MQVRPPVHSLRTLDEETQRRIILQAAKACGADTFNEFKKKQPTIAELDNELRETFWVGLFFVWTIFLPILLALGSVSEIRVRNMAWANWRQWLTSVDPECSMLVIEGDIRRILRKLPRRNRRQAREITRELERVMSYWSDLNEKSEMLARSFPVTSEAELNHRQINLVERINRESDMIVLASLQRQVQAIEGQREALRNLTLWRARLETAREECRQSLLHLRSQLMLMVASGGSLENAAFTEATTTLQQLNESLSATQNAVEEVLRISAS